jgi:hypothetical protein
MELLEYGKGSLERACFPLFGHYVATSSEYVRFFKKGRYFASNVNQFVK